MVQGIQEIFWFIVDCIRVVVPLQSLCSAARRRSWRVFGPAGDKERVSEMPIAPEKQRVAFEKAQAKKKRQAVLGR
jgi:hypothetical protein